jgi:hypothetical protein
MTTWKTIDSLLNNIIFAFLLQNSDIWQNHSYSYITALFKHWYINVLITILDNVQHPVFYLKHDVSETEFYLPSLIELLSWVQ